MSPHTLNKAIAHIKKDVEMARVIEKLPKPKFVKNDNPFQSLVRAIIFQQLSGKAAGTILQRFNELFTDKTPTPRKVGALKDEKIQQAGVSKQKIGYLKDLSAKFLDGTINPNKFSEMTDEAIREHLIAVKGIGRWTADMFLMFTLHRPDVLPVGDLGIQKGFQKVFTMKKLPDAKKMEKIAEKWRPYRTVASMYLWRVLDSGGEW